MATLLFQSMKAFQFQDSIFTEAQQNILYFTSCNMLSHFILTFMSDHEESYFPLANSELSASPFPQPNPLHTHNVGHLFPEAQCLHSSLLLRIMNRRTITRNLFRELPMTNISLYKVEQPDWRVLKMGKKVEPALKMKALYSSLCLFVVLFSAISVIHG